MSEIEIFYQINNEDKKCILKTNEEYISQKYIKSKMYEELISLENYEDEYDLEESNINYEYIRYYDPELKGWLLLNESEYIKVNAKEPLKLLIKLRIKTIEEIKIRQQFDDIDKEIEELSNTIKRSKNKNNNNEIKNNDSEIDICVLTANPLIDKNSGKEKELKSMNDFNNITNSIKNVIIESNKLINAEFLPLTERNLKKIISYKPKIIHLICKSTYIIPENDKEKDKNSMNYISLLFEDNNFCEMKIIKKEDLNNIFNTEEISNTLLIISTQLSEDVYNMVKDYKFKNILIQHTTISDTSFIADFNEHFYKNIIEQIDNGLINSCFEDAKNINFESHQFCCCFHEHKNNCKLMKNLINELYIIEKDENLKENEFDSKYIPHFLHLRYNCNCKKDFNIHLKDCKDNNPSKKDNICCCFQKDNKKQKNNIKEKGRHNKKNKEHNIDNIFFRNFSGTKNNNIIKLDDSIGNFGIIKNPENVPNYEKMKLILGRNRLVYDIFKLLMESKYNLINIYKEKQEFIEIVDIIIEYLKERVNILYNEENNKILKDKDNNNKLLNNNKNSQLNHFNSASISSIQKNDYIFEKIILKKDDIFKPKNRDKIIYFIITFEDNDLINKIFDNLDIDIFKYQIVLFTKNEYELDEKYIKNNQNLKIKKIELKPMTRKQDYNILYQNEKIKKTKEEFDHFIEQKLIENEKIIYIKEKDDENNLNNEYLNIKEILYLFYCLKSGIYEMELKEINLDKKIECKQIIIKEKDLNKRININNNFDIFYNMMKNNISDDIKQGVLIKLFKFYSKIFRYIIQIAKIRSDFNNYVTYIKKYKPIESLTSFSAIQKLGIWLQSNENKNEKNDDDIDIKKIEIVKKAKAEEKYFRDLSYNFVNVFTDENIYLCRKNKDIWNKVKQDLEDISITYYTCLLMFDFTHYELRNLISKFKELFENQKEFLFSSSRLKLMKCMYSETIEHDTKNLEELNKILNEFKENKSIEGELETMFAIFVINLKENIDIYKDILEKINMIEKDNEYNIKNKEYFIKVFKCKTKYVYIKYKIKHCICSDEDLYELGENKKDENIPNNTNKCLASSFKDTKNYFYEIKTYILIAEYYFNKYKSNNDLVYKDKFIAYINFIFYTTKIHDDIINKKNDFNNFSFYGKYIKNYIESKKNMKKIKKEEKEDIFQKIIGQIKILCEKYGYEYKEKIKEIYIDQEDKKDKN